MRLAAVSEPPSALGRGGLAGVRRTGSFVYAPLAAGGHGRKFSDVVLAELAAGGAVRKDRDLTARILALPHDLVCEQGRAALLAPIAPAAPAADPDSASCSASHPNTDPQEAP